MLSSERIAEIRKEILNDGISRTENEYATELVYRCFKELSVFPKKIYAVLSREQGLILCTTDPKKAEDSKRAQYEQEEMGGGRPSVYIEETEIVL